MAERYLQAGELSLENLPAVLTVEEVANILRVNRKTVYEAVARKEIQGYLRIGRVIRFSREAFLEWLRSQGCVSHKRRQT